MGGRSVTMTDSGERLVLVRGIEGSKRNAEFADSASWRTKAELRAVLKMARAALGYKPNGRRGAKLSPEHIKALQEGRRRYFQAKREKKATRAGLLDREDCPR